MKKLYIEMMFSLAHWMIYVGYKLEDHAYELDWDDKYK